MDSPPSEASDGGARPLLDEEMVRTIYHSVNDAIAVHDAETGAIVDVNETMCEMYGYTREEIRDLTVEDLSSGSPPYTQETAVEYVRKAADGAPQVFDWRAKDSEGDLFWVEVSMRRTALEDGEYVLVVVRDITDRKAYEQRLEAQRDNLEILNQMFRHDIRNDLQLVQGYAEMLAEHVDEDGREYLSTVRESTANAVGLTRTAGELAEVMLRSDIRDQQTPLAPILHQQVAELRSEHPEATVDVEGSLPQVTVVGNELLESLFRNLLENAIQHNDRDQPAVTVSATRRGDRVEVRVADNGPGIPDAQKETIFGKGEKRLDSPGTGIGLYLVETLAESAGGDVRVEDNEPRGAVFVVELPIAE